MINYDEFKKMEIVMGKILSVEVVEDTDKLLKLSVDLGEESPRCIVSGIREYFEDYQSLVGQTCAFVANLEPRTIRGVESQGMILATHAGDKLALLSPTVPVDPGSTVS